VIPGGGDQRADEQDRGGGARHRHAALLHGVGQAAFDLLDAGLHFVLRLHRVYAAVEGERDARRAFARGGDEVEEPVEPGQAVLDDLGDRTLDRLGRGAGIGG
jgi:hypothetical protein